MGPYQILFESEKRKIVKHWYDQINTMISQSKGIYCNIEVTSSN